MSFSGPPQPLDRSDEHVLFGCGAVCLPAEEAGASNQFNKWLRGGGVFANLRSLCVVLHWGRKIPNLEISPARFPVLEKLQVRFKTTSCSGNRGLCVHAPTLRKLSLTTCDKNAGGIRALAAPQLELLNYKGGGTDVAGYSPVCCQLGRALADDSAEFASLKAFRWNVEYMSEHDQPSMETLAIPGAGFECRGTGRRAITKLLASPRLAAAAIRIGRIEDGVEPISFELRSHLLAFSMEEGLNATGVWGSSSGDGGSALLHRTLPLDTLAAASLRWLKISLQWRFESQLCHALVQNCPGLEHVYISGPDPASNALTLLATHLANLRVVSVSYASQDGHIPPPRCRYN